jgi:hypothetical protein
MCVAAIAVSMIFLAARWVILVIFVYGLFAGLVLAAHAGWFVMGSATRAPGERQGVGGANPLR